MTSLLDRLETAGFVRRSAHPTNRRVTLIRLSAAMSHLGPGALPYVAAVLSHLANGLAEQATEVNTPCP